MILFAILITLDFFFIGYTKYVLIAFLKWVEAHPWPGVFTFSAVYCIATILWIPGSLLTLGAGYIFGRAFGIGVGIALGTLSVFIGASSGAIIAFLFGRYIFQDIAQDWCKKYPILLAIDKVSPLEPISSSHLSLQSFLTVGFKLMLLLRLSPIVPFCVINYLIAGTSLSFRDYATSLFGILPGTVAYVFIGTTLSNYLGFHDDNHDEGGGGGSHKKTTKWIQLVSLIVGILLTLLATVILSYHARQELLKYQTQSQESEQDVVSYSPDLLSPFHGEGGTAPGFREDSMDSRASGSQRSSSKHSNARSTKSSYVGGETIEEYSVYM
jgi:uncharacterized membrane protein YdjX (TVP38/TMEM64 family)